MRLGKLAVLGREPPLLGTTAICCRRLLGQPRQHNRLSTAYVCPT